MSWTTFAILSGFATLLVKTGMDWPEHIPRKRRGDILLCLLGLASAIGGIAASGKTSHEAVALREQLEISNRPKPLARLRIGLVDPTLGTQIVDSKSETTAPLEGDHVTIAIDVANDSDLKAQNVTVFLRLCTGCTFLTGC